MRRALAAFALLATMLAGPVAAGAAEETAKLNVEMYCGSCVWIVTNVLEEVNGVTAVDVSFQDQLATVTFDNQETDAGALAQAITDYGFPAEVLAN